MVKEGETRMKNRVLIVAMASSVHTARWIRQIQYINPNLQITIFDATDTGHVHSLLQNVTVHRLYYTKSSRSVKIRGFYLFHQTVCKVVLHFMNKYHPLYRKNQLKKLIKKLKPDFIHSLETQHAGYLVATVKKEMESFPSWFHTNWGSDIYLFGGLKDHKEKIREVMENCDYYSCECHRDVELAKQFGLNGTVFPVLPNTGGYHLDSIKTLRQAGKTSDRKIIMLKGYQGWAGRALSGLRALERCSDLLSGYEVHLYSVWAESVEIKAKLLEEKIGIPFHLVPHESSHNDILALHGKARISIGVNISDGVSTSFLEAFVMGSFPIQSCTACAEEWIEDGKTGFIVPPEDPAEIEIAIRRALTDDALVDFAAQKNFEVAQERLEYKMVAEKSYEFYKTILSKNNE